LPAVELQLAWPRRSSAPVSACGRTVRVAAGRLAEGACLCRCRALLLAASCCLVRRARCTR